VSDPRRVRELAAQISSDPSLAALSERERRRLSDDAFRRCAEAILADDQLSAEEEDAFVELSEALGIDQEAFETRHRDLRFRLFIARVNDGRLPVIDEPRLSPALLEAGGGLGAHNDERACSVASATFEGISRSVRMARFGVPKERCSVDLRTSSRSSKLARMTSEQLVRCTVCRGTGLCSACGGTGVADVDQANAPCPECGGSGTCAACRGAGRVSPHQ
jgi:hypothetical protein